MMLKEERILKSTGGQKHTFKASLVLIKGEKLAWQNGTDNKLKMQLLSDYQLLNIMTLGGLIPFMDLTSSLLQINLFSNCLFAPAVVLK
jgi:hypothetical protein